MSAPEFSQLLYFFLPKEVLTTNKSDLASIVKTIG